MLLFDAVQNQCAYSLPSWLLDLPSKIKPVPGLNDDVRETIAAARIQHFHIFHHDVILSCFLIAPKEWCDPMIFQDAVKAELIRTEGDVQAGGAMKASG